MNCAVDCADVDDVVAGTQKFTVRGHHKGLLYESSQDGARVGAKRLTVTGESVGLPG